jgi:ribosome biogenesis GTPase A
MMNDAVIDPKFNAYKTRLSELLENLQQLASEAGSAELHEIVSNLRTQINEPFLFVIVGEVKSGKSSFINALLQEEVCRVDPAPCTDRVQQIVYSESRKEWTLNPQLAKIGLPLDLLKTIAIVDTPGTNTVIAHHQEITERFIPYSDLVIFVFSAKNPHTQSAWDLLSFVSQEWHRKIIFVLQQADIASEHELEVNIRAVSDYARKRHLTSPQIFSTSAKWELDKDPRSGFDKIRQFIRATITGGQHVRQKLQSNASAATQVAGNLRNSLNEQKRQLDSDIKAEEKIKSRLSIGKDKSTYEIESLIQLLASNYNRIANYIKEDFHEAFR